MAWNYTFHVTKSDEILKATQEIFQHKPFMLHVETCKAVIVQSHTKSIQVFQDPKAFQWMSITISKIICANCSSSVPTQMAVRHFLSFWFSLAVFLVLAYKKTCSVTVSSFLLAWCTIIVCKWLMQISEIKTPISLGTLSFCTKVLTDPTENVIERKRALEFGNH